MRSRVLLLLELVILIALILVTRCANYADVFVAGQVHFLDPDCYARMARAKICFEHPGTIIRRHSFENFPDGTSPHTTAPLDYLIVGIAALLAPLTPNRLDLAGAVVSPLISIGLGIFLWWWTRRMQLPYRWAVLLLFILSPILAHGFAIGRPDHQSLALGLVAVALCAEWTLTREISRRFAITSAAAWALAIWVSPYEPLILLALLLGLRRGKLFGPDRRVGWLVFGAIIVIALILERRIPSPPETGTVSELRNWSGTIGELAHVPLTSLLWFQWCGWLVILTPLLFWPVRQNSTLFLAILLGAAFLLTIWQARWGYFFGLLFALMASDLLSRFPWRWLGWTIFLIGLFPIAQAWDNGFSVEERARQAEHNIEQIELRRLAERTNGPFIAPWWFSPALSYWSGQPGLAGSSHESIAGITATARFFASDNADEARAICAQRGAKYVASYDAERVAKNTEAILARPISSHALLYLLDRRASAAPDFLRVDVQTGRFKLFHIENL